MVNNVAFTVFISLAGVAMATEWGDPVPSHEKIGLSFLEKNLLDSRHLRTASTDIVGPPPPPPPPAITFDASLDDYTVLQQSPSDAYVFGATSSSDITVKVSGPGCPDMTTHATVFNGTWRAKVPGPKGGDCMILVTDGNGNSANITHVTYGDVWYCGGQSNMALPGSFKLGEEFVQAACSAHFPFLQH